MKVIVLGGFLGSGKTSVLLELSKYLVHKLQGKENSLIIIENEVGDASIDDKILGESGLVVTGLNTGCVCCEMTAELNACVNMIQRNLDPEWLIIEASGVAIPYMIVQTLAMHGRGITSIDSIVVEDAERFDKIRRRLPDIVEKQLVGANIVLLNKVDCVDAEMEQQIKDQIAEMHPKAMLYSVSAEKGIGFSEWERIIGDERNDV